jgi:hypothetical protein
MSNDNPYQSSEAADDVTKSPFPLRLIGKIALGMVAVLLLIALLLPLQRGGGGPARRNMCINKLRQVAMALENYESANGTLPPAYTVDAEGNRLHSWRTLILPFIEESPLFETIDLSRPWDDPANAEARKAVVHLYSCPSAVHAEGLTTYQAIVGPDCVFSGSVPRALSEIAGGPENAMVVIEVDSDRAVHWMSPHDTAEDVVLGYGPDSKTNHPRIILAAFLDGHVELLPLDSAPEKRRARMTIDGGVSTTD